MHGKSRSKSLGLISENRLWTQGFQAPRGEVGAGLGVARSKEGSVGEEPVCVIGP